MRNRFAVLRLRELRLVFGATAVSRLGDGIVTVALAFAVLDLTGRAIDLGIVLACGTVAQVLALLVGGVVSDRTDRRRVMIAADLVRLVGQATIFVLLVTHSATVFEIALSQIVLGVAGGFFNPASSGLLPAVAGEHLHEANALNGIASAASSIAGPAIGGLLVAAAGASWALGADAVSYALSALFLSRVGARAAAAAGESSFLADLRGGFQEVSSRSWVWSLIISFAIGNSLSGMWGVFGPLICRRAYGGAPAFAALSVAFSVGSLVGGASLLRFRPGRPLVVGVLVCLPMSVPALLLAAGAPLAAVLPFSVLSGFGPIVFNTLWWTTLQERVPPEAISRVISYDFAGSFALSPIGLALAGPLAVALGLRPAMYLVASLAIVVVAVSLLVPEVRSIRRMERVPGVEDPVIVEA